MKRKVDNEGGSLFPFSPADEQMSGELGVLLGLSC